MPSQEQLHRQDGSRSLTAAQVGSENRESSSVGKTEVSTMLSTCLDSDVSLGKSVGGYI